MAGTHASTLTETVPAAEGCCQGESWCAVTCTSQVLSRKWHTVIVHRLLLHGPLRFSELADRIDGISAKVLTESLEDLVDSGLLDRRVLAERPRKVSYRLTEAGRNLQPVIEAMEAWGRQHLYDRP